MNVPERDPTEVKSKQSLHLVFVSLLLFCIPSWSIAAKTFQPWSEKVFIHINSEYGAQAEKRMRYLHDIVMKNQGKSVQEKLRLVNDTMNNLPWIADEQHWKKADYWAPPMETIATFGGDCEDIAIAKWMMLRYLGVPGNKLRLAYVKVKATGENHMVLAYVNKINIPREERLSHTWILDNINPRLLTADKRTDLFAIYATDADGNLVIFKDTGKERSIIKVRENASMKKLEEIKDKIEKNAALFQKINDGRPLYPH